MTRARDRATPKVHYELNDALVEQSIANMIYFYKDELNAIAKGEVKAKDVFGNGQILNMRRDNILGFYTRPVAVNTPKGPRMSVRKVMTVSDETLTILDALNRKEKITIQAEVSFRHEHPK